MAWIYQALEIADEGTPTGRYRMTRHSDEDGGGPFGLCECVDGHPSKEEARTCPVAAAELERQFPKGDT